jgi:hypothetical protein
MKLTIALSEVTKYFSSSCLVTRLLKFTKIMIKLHGLPMTVFIATTVYLELYDLELTA